MTLTGSTDAQEQPVALRSGLPLTAMQRPLWSSQRRNPSAPLQNMALLSHLDGPVDGLRLAEAFAAVVAASDVLRSTVREVDGVARAHVGRRAATTELLDLDRSVTEAWARQRVAVPLDLGDCGYDSVVIRHPDGTASWYLALHHAITDATSSMLVFEATAAAYWGADVDLGSYYAWASERAGRDDPRRRAAAAHWAARSPRPRLGRLYQPAHHPEPAASRVPIPFDGALASAAARRVGGDLKMVSEDLGWTVLLVTAAAAYLHRVTGEDRFAIGLPVHNRSEPAARRLIGPLMEVFPLDVAVEAGDTYRELHRRVGRAVLATLRHAVPGTAPAAPDVEAVVNVIPRAGLGSFGEVPATTRWIHAGAADPSHLFRLQLTAYGGRGDEGRELVLDLNHAAAAERHRARAGGHLGTILEDLVTDPDQSLGARSLCAPAERSALARWGTGPDPGPPPPPVTTSLARALAGSPHVALRDGERTWTGGELWSQVRRTAHQLSQRGAGPGRRVGIALPRSAEAVIATLATLVAGASYVPLDPAHPERRRRRLAERAGVVTVVDSPDQLALGGHPEGGEAGRGPEGGEAGGPAGPDDEAYLLFTSGSTGEPKGVPVTHRGLARYLQFAHRHYLPEGGKPVVPLFSALTFDLTVTSLYLPLQSGGELVVIGEDGPAGLRAIAERPELTWAKATPSHLELLVRLLGPGHGLRTLVVGGEAFPARLARRLAERLPGVRLFNEYGPTEAVVGCMIHEAGDQHPGEVDVPIGRPAPGVTLRVLDRYGHLVPEGCPGELHIASEGVTRGYLGQPESTSGDGPGTDPAGPFRWADGVRWYRSGDLVRLLDERTLTFLGRVDEQLKVGGIRLDPGEVADALTAHPAVRRAAVRLWRPRTAPPAQHCVRCGLPSNVPGVGFDHDGVCGTCHDYDRVKEHAAAYFRTRDELVAWRERARADRTGRYDCVHLLSGGKDSTYALYQLVAMGFDVYAFTLDNGFISEDAKANIRRSVADLGVDHEFATTEAMAEIFRDSLERHSNVCNGCYKTIYTLATNRALQLGAPLVVTGLSRGQLFETRLVPAQFAAERFEPDAIDRAVLSARKVYHRADDAVRRHLDTSAFDDDATFDRVTYLDFYRYVDVELSDVLAFLDSQAPWVRPRDTGRSTNCLINAAGIHTHLTEQGFHNYAVPYAWDVRLGHKERDQAMAELDDRLDVEEVTALLDRVGYTPRPRDVLTAWYELAEGAPEPTPAELRTTLAERLPAHAVPQAFVAVGQLPVTGNGKLDAAALPAPSRVHRPGPALYVSPQSPLESRIVAIWERVLGVEPIGVDDGFFALGGDSLAALEAVMALSAELGRTVREDLAFAHTTPRQLAAALVVGAGESPGRSGPDSPPRRAPRAEPPLSIGEQAILFEQLAAPGDPRYHVGRRYRVSGPVDAARFRAALEAVVEAHVPLHWTFGEPRRRLPVDAALSLRVETGASSPARFAAAAAELHRHPFDLEAGPLVRGLFQPLDDGTTGIALAFHHVSIDAGSFDRLWEELAARYAGQAPPAALFDYAEHLAWQEARLDEGDRAFWSAPQRAVEVATVRLGSAPVRAAGAAADGVGAPAGGGYRERLASVDLRALRGGPGPTPFANALTAVVGVLAARADRAAIGIGLTTSTRDHPDADPLVGYYLNTVPLVVEVPEQTSFGDLARRCGDEVGAALAHRTYPLARIVADRRAAGLPPPPSRILVAFEELAGCSLGGLPADHDILASGSAVADATFFIQVRGERVHLGLEYAQRLLDAAGAEQLLDEVDELLRRGVTRAATPVGRRPAPPARVVPVEWQESPRPDLAGPATLDGLLRAAAARHPGRVAVACGAASVSFAELDARANRLARLLRSLGAGPEVRVAVLGARRADTIVAIVGVLRAGAAYVPLDPAHPPERLERTLADCGASIVVGAGWSPTGTPPPGTTTVAQRVDLAAIDLSRWPATPPPDGPRPEHLAYVVYTSGSTGTPKGVMVEHRHIAASTLARRGVYGRGPDRFLLLSPFAFDSSMAGLFWTLASGGTVVLPEEDAARDVGRLGDLVAGHRVTHLLALPSLHQVLTEEVDAGHLASLRTAIVAGEACTAAVVAAHRLACPQAELVNEYGPTEATVWSHAHRVPASHEGPVVPVGRPIPNATCLVLDRDGKPVPVGTAGELYIGGAGVSRGYLGRPELTAERFVELDESVAGRLAGRFYRSGDLVSWDEQGNLVFHGRVDHQVKLRGHRVEPEEVEAVLAALAGVREAAVVAQGAARDLRLVAYVAGSADLDAATVRAGAARTLPEALVPTAVVVLDALPRTSNGKVDRAALPAPAPAAPPRAAPAGPPSAAEVAMVELWREVLGVDAVDPDDDFFDLGGDSLLAIRIFARLRRRFGVDLPLPILFEAATPRALAAEVEARIDRAGTGRRGREAGGAAGPAWTHVVPITRGPPGRPPFFCVHGLGGNVLNLRTLAVSLGHGWTFVGLQASGVDGIRPLHRSVDELCEAYLAELTAYHPGGPYLLGGYSHGGLIAYELAQRLRADERSVAAVVLLDTIHPAHAGSRIPLRTHLSELRRRGPRYVGERLAERRQRARRHAEDAVLDRYEDVPGEPAPWEVRERRLFVHNMALLAPYRPDPYDGRVVMMSATDDWKYQHLPADRGWSVVVPDIEVVRTPGDHVSLLEGANGVVLAERLRPVLERILEGS